MTIVFESSYCNVYGTEYQLRYVYRNNGSGIAVEYITGTSNLYQIWGRHKEPDLSRGIEGVDYFIRFGASSGEESEWRKTNSIG
jgi:hypothetical protein